MPLTNGFFYFVLDPLAASSLAPNEDGSHGSAPNLLVNPPFDRRITALLDRLPDGTVVKRIDEPSANYIAISDLSYAPGVAFEVKTEKDFAHVVSLIHDNDRNAADHLRLGVSADNGYP